MDNQSTIDWLDRIKTMVERGNAKAALINLDKLRYTMLQREGQAIPDYADYPAILREQAI